MRISCFIIVCCLAFGSCDFVNPAERTPTYVHIDSFAFQPTPGTGTSSHKITSAWVYFNGSPVGIFDLPVTFPVLADKQGTLTIIPGITKNGLNDFQAQYPFYASDTISLTPLNDLNFEPTTKYIDTSILKFWMEDFEFGNSFTKLSGDTGITKTNDPAQVFEGGFSGIISLNAGNTSEIIATANFTGNVNSYLELNYKCSVAFEVGLYTTSSTGQPVISYLFGFKPKADWNKVYIGLGDFIAAFPNKSYNVVIKTSSDASSGGYVLLDNFKAVSIK